jgi:hypothetical protein
MVRLLRALVGLMALLFIGIALQFMLFPETAAERFALVPRGIQGLNTLRGDLGGLLLGGGVLMAAGVIYRQTFWWLAAAAIVAAIAFGRVVGFVFDGWQGNSLGEAVLELVIVILLLTAHRVCRQTDR